MFRRIDASHASRDGLTRSWFQAPSVDLHVWQDASGALASFQLSYDKPGNEKVLTWKTGSGFRHHAVDSGDNPGGHPRSPLLGEQLPVSWPAIATLFQCHAGSLPPRLEREISSLLKDH